MATDLQPAPSASIPKHEAYVEKQLQRVQQRIRWLDLAAAALGFAILTLGYGLLMVLLDRLFQLPLGARQAAFVVYLLGAVGYLGWTVALPLLRRINPYFAARQLERTLPEAKNSIVNWLDLREQALSPSVQTALGQRAARDLTQANVEEAVNPKQATWMGGIAAGLLLGMFLLFLFGPGQFSSLLKRAFAPFGDTSVPTRTTLVLLQPEKGDLEVRVGHAVSFSVEVQGRVPHAGAPDAVRLLYRYQDGDAFEERPLDRGDSSAHWVGVLPAPQVRNGFWYKIAAGDTLTAEYRVGVKTPPLVTGFDVTYRYRKYRGGMEQTDRNANLTAHRGTEVTLVARTNRAVKEGQLVIDGAKPILAELLPDDPQAMRFQLTLTQDGKYRIFFTSAENEKNTDPMAYTIKVLSDLAPTVELKKPGIDIELPANGTLRLEGVARDDFGVASLVLHLKLEDGTMLKAKPYREGKSFQLADNTFPQTLDYKDFVELEKVQLENGRLWEPKPGQVLEYELEAADGCDVSGPHVARTPTYRVKITEPPKEPDQQDQQKQERDLAQKEQKQHEQQQDQRLNQENKQRQGDKPPKPQPNKDQPQQPDEPNPEQQPGKDEQRKKDEETQRKLDDLQNQARKQEQEQKNQPGQPKNDEPQPEPGEAKNDNPQGQPQQPDQGQPKQGQPQKQEAGQPKNEPQQNQQGQEGQSKAQPQQGNGGTQNPNEQQRPPEGTAKGNPRNEPKAEPKNGGDQQTAGGEPKQGPQSGTSQPNNTTASADKPDKPDPMNPGQPQGEPKNAGQPQNTGTAANQQQPQPGQGDSKAAAREMAKQLFSDDPKQREEAARKMAEMNRDVQRGTHSNDPKQQADAERKRKDAIDAAKEFTEQAKSQDEKTRQAAADALKQAMDKVNKEEKTAHAGEKQKLDDLNKQLGSGNAQEQHAARKQLQQMAQEAGSRETRQAAKDAVTKHDQQRGNGQGDPKHTEQIDKLAKQMAGGDPQQREAAREQLEKMAKDANDPQTRQAAQDALAKNEPQPSDPKAKVQIDNLAKQMAGGNEQERAAAKKQLEQMAKEAKDAGTRQAAQEALKRDNATAQGNGGQGDPKQREEIEKLAQQMQSGDPKQREDARQRLEQMAKDAKNEQARKDAQRALQKADGERHNAEQRAEQLTNALENLAKQLQNMDAKQREELLKQLQEMAQNAPKPEGQPRSAELERQAKEVAQALEKLSPEAKKTLQELSQQLQSKNDQERQNAEKKLDEMRKNAQNDADRQAAEAMQKQHQQQQASGRRAQEFNPDKPGNVRDDPPQPAAAADRDLANRAGSLTLQDFQKFMKNLTPEQRNEAKITEQDLKEMEDFLRRREATRTDPEKLGDPSRGGILPNQGVRKVESSTQATTGAQRGGFALPPPDLREGQNEFSKILSERQKKRGK